MLPDKDIKCHETGFAKSCFECVVDHKCRKWVHFLGKNPQTGDDVDVWDCRDHVEHFFWIEAARVQRATTASVDALRKEVAESNDQGMGGVLARINAQMQHEREVRAQLTMELESKMLEGAK